MRRDAKQLGYFLIRAIMLRCVHFWPLLFASPEQFIGSAEIEILQEKKKTQSCSGAILSSAEWQIKEASASKTRL